ncbi:MAG TPA: hypothetical protein VK906_01205 [Egicoccus sp.]|nr:hypothetical protein [Egicoccus sp.]HSK21756.1 hypothetical protein [Egicoccus sp.]
MSRRRLLRPLAAVASLAVALAACGDDGSGYGPRNERVAGEPGVDQGLFPGSPWTFDEDYAPRSNVAQTVAAPLPDGEWGGDGWVFVANEVANGVTVLDLRTLTPIDFVYSPDSPVPHHPYLSPDQRWVSTNTRFGNNVIVIDTHDDFARTILTFPEAEGGEDVAGPLHGTYTHDSRYFIVALQRSDRVGVVDMQAEGGPEILEVIDIGDRPRDVYVTPDDGKAFISHQGENYVTVLDIGSWEVRQIQRSDADYSSAGGGGGGMSEDGTLFAVANTPEQQVVVIDTETEQVVHRVDGVPAPVNVEFLGNTHMIGIGNRADGSATFIDADSGELLATVETGGGANIPYMGPDGNIWVTHNGAGHLSVIDPETFEVIDEVAVGVNPHWLHFLPSGSRALATNWGEDKISVIDTVRRRQLTTVQTGLNPNGIVVKTDVTPEQAAAALGSERSLQARQDVPAASEMLLPEPRDDQEQLFLNTCVQCHDMGRIVRNNSSTYEDWNAIVLRMRGNGAVMTDEEIEEITDYLTEGRHQEIEIATRYAENYRAAGEDADPPRLP